MKKIVLVLLLFLTTGCFAKSMVPIQTWQTQNGAKVFFVRLTQLPMLDINVVFKAGSAYDAQQCGLSSLTNNMIGEGALGLNADQIAKAFDQVGANFSVGSGRDMASVSLRTLTQSKYRQPAIQAFHTVLTQPNFPEDAFSRVQKQTLVAIKASLQDPNTVAKHAFYANLYRNEPYGHPVAGDLNSLPKLSTEDVKQFYLRYYVANNADVILVGDITRAQATNIANQIMQGMPSGSAASALPTAKPLAKASMVQVNFPSKQTSILMGQVGINRQNADYFPLIVGNYVLGGMPLNSILFEQVRNQRGLAYGAYSGFNPLMLKGPFSIQVQTRNEKADESRRVIQQVLDNFVKNGPTQAQLDAAKKNLIGGFPLMIDSNGNIMNLVTNIAFYHRPLNFLDTYVKNVKAVTVADIQKAFAKTIQPANQLTVLVGPTTNKQQTHAS